MSYGGDQFDLPLRVRARERCEGVVLTPWFDGPAKEAPAVILDPKDLDPPSVFQ